MDNIKINQSPVVIASVADKEGVAKAKAKAKAQTGIKAEPDPLKPTEAERSKEGKTVAAVANPADKEQEVQEAVQQLSDYIQKSQRSLQFNYDKEAGTAVITVLDKDTQEVIRRIPDDVALELARNLNNEGEVSLFNTKV